MKSTTKKPKPAQSRHNMVNRLVPFSPSTTRWLRAEARRRDVSIVRVVQAIVDQKAKRA